MAQANASSAAAGGGDTDTDFTKRPLKDRFQPAPKKLAGAPPAASGSHTRPFFSASPAPAKPGLQQPVPAGPQPQQPKQAVPSLTRPPQVVPVVIRAQGVRPPVRPPQPVGPSKVPKLIKLPEQPVGPPPGSLVRSTPRVVQAATPQSTTAQAFSMVKAGSSVLPPAKAGQSSSQKCQRLALNDFPEDWKDMDREEIVTLITERLSVFGQLAGKPVLITSPVDGSRRGFAAFMSADDAANAVEAAKDLGFGVTFDTFVPPSREPPKIKPPEEPAKLVAKTLYIDELEMPERPDVGPSPTDREVWIDPLPDDNELSDWLHAFGQAEEVCRLPNPETGAPSERGYVLFHAHEAAKACVDAYAGTWSESERAMSSQLSLRRSVVRAYPESIVSAFLGRGGEDINKLRKVSGVWKLAVKGADLAMKGAPLDKDLAEQRLHFWAEGRVEAIDNFKPQLERRLAEIHTEIRNRLTELGGQWKLDQERDLAKHQGRHGRDERRHRKRRHSPENQDGKDSEEERARSRWRSSARGEPDRWHQSSYRGHSVGRAGGPIGRAPEQRDMRRSRTEEPHFRGYGPSPGPGRASQPPIGALFGTRGGGPPSYGGRAWGAATGFPPDSYGSSRVGPSMASGMDHRRSVRRSRERRSGGSAPYDPEDSWDHPAKVRRGGRG